MPCLYTVYRCKSMTDDSPKGATHFSDNGEETLCGKGIIYEKWFIADNKFSGKATCKKCSKIDTETTLEDRAK
jgi:hypothetical protein